MRLQAGTNAPDFAGETLKGGQLSLESLQGQNVFLKFYRYASCLVCNLHVMEYENRRADITKAGVTIVMVFHSPRSLLEKNLKTDVSFDVIADPEKQIFRMYNVGASWKGMFLPGMLGDYVKAIRHGFFSKKLFGNEGGDKGHPADFLIDGEGIIRYAHYGEHYSDSLSVDDSIRLAQELENGNGVA